MNEAQRKILLHAINHFGVEANVNKALEEMGELTAELSRRRLDRFDRDKVAEEIADVLITVEKLRIIYGGAKVDRIVEKKLAALEGNMLRPSGDDFNMEQFESALEKFARTAASIIPHSEDAKRQERMMPKGMVVHLDFERHLKETQNRPDAQEIRRCCLFCRHIRPTPEDFTCRRPWCGITGQEIIGNPRLMSCGRFEPTLEEKEGSSNE